MHEQPRVGVFEGRPGTLLHISVRTAEFHRKNIQRKLDLTSRAQLVQHALESGFLES